MPPKRLLLISNPRSRHGDVDLAPVLSVLRRAGIEVIHQVVEQPARIPDAIESCAATVDGVLLAGGDGTFNTAVQALHRHGLTMGLLPLGTANDLAGTLGIPVDLEAAAEVVVAGHVVRVDLGEANGHLFFNVAHLGLPVAVTEQISDTEKRRWGVLGYLKALRRALQGNAAFRARITCSGRRVAGRFVQITIGNGRRHGGGMVVDPEAGIADGCLHLYAVRPGGWWRLLRVASALRRGRRGPEDVVLRMSGTAVRVDTRVSLPVATDGEITTRTPIDVHVHRGAVPIYVPAGFEANEGARDAA